MSKNNVYTYEDLDYKAVVDEANNIIKWYKKEGEKWKWVGITPYNPQLHELLDKTNEVYLLYEVVFWASYLY